MALIGILGILISVLLGSGMAQAQTTTPPYPPGTGTTTCVHTNTIDAGTLDIGQTATFLLCGPFSGPVVVTVDGTVAFANKTPVNGAVTVVVTRISATTVAVDDPVNVATVCGTNTVIATGAGVSNGTATANGTFTVVCAAPTTTATTGLAFTGANILLALVVAMVLIGLGVLLVIFQRRRRQTI